MSVARGYDDAGATDVKLEGYLCIGDEVSANLPKLFLILAFNNTS